MPAILSKTPSQKMVNDPGTAVLYNLIVESDWQAAASHCNDHPEEASKWIGKKDSNNAIVWHRLPIHEACRRNPSEIIIDALVKAFPKGSAETDSNGRLPLHHACAHGASREVVEKLLMSYPESVEVKDTWCKLPAHVARGSSAANRDEIVALVQLTSVEWHLRRNNAVIMKENDDKIRNLESQFNSERQSYMEKFASLQSTSERERALLKDEIGALSANAQEDRTVLNRNIRELKAVVEALKGDSKDSQTQLQESLASQSKLTLQLEEARTHINEKDGVNAELSASLASSSTKVAVLHNAVESRNEKEAELKAEIDTIKEQMRNITAKIDGAISDLSKRDRKFACCETDSVEEKLQLVFEKIGDLCDTTDTLSYSVFALEEQRDEAMSSLGLERANFEEIAAKADKELEEILRINAKLEKKVEKDADSITSLYQLLSEMQITASKRNDEANHCQPASGQHQEEKRHLECKIQMLENTIKALIRRKSTPEPAENTQLIDNITGTKQPFRGGFSKRQSPAF